MRIGFGNITLSRAAEIADLTLRDILLKGSRRNRLELNYDVRELQRDMEV